jgi:RNA polymerase sigma-70 factor (ECF subfamily)
MALFHVMVQSLYRFILVFVARNSGLSTHQELGELVIAVASNRDRAAFAQLFDHFGPRLHAYLVRLGSDGASADEILQDVMATLWTKAHLFDPAKSSIATWLYRIARNRRIDTLRRDRLDFFDPMDAPEIAAEDAGTDRKIDMQFREERIKESLTALPEEQLLLIRMAFFDDLSHSEIAEKTGLPLGTVKSRIRLAFSKLRRQLETNGVIDAGSEA